MFGFYIRRMGSGNQPLIFNIRLMELRKIFFTRSLVAE